MAKKSAKTWQDRLDDLFSTRVMTRGASYFRQGRVFLEKATATEIEAVVDGSEEYLVKIIDDMDQEGGTLRALCECPHFQSGNACKHLWASILAADAELAKYKQAEDKAGMASTAAPWRKLLFPDNTKTADGQSRWDGSPGQFLLRYELWVDNMVRLTAIKQKVLKSGKPGKQAAPAQHKILQEQDLPALDRSILDSLHTLYFKEISSGYYWSRYYHQRKFDQCRLDAPTMKKVLPELAETGRCRVFRDGSLAADPLRMGAPFEAGLEFTLDPESLGKRKKNLVYTPQVRVGDELRPMQDIPAFFSTTPLLFILDGALHQLPGPDLAWVIEMRRNKHKVSVPKAEARELFLAQEAAGAPAQLELPEEMGPKALSAAEPSPSLEVALGEEGISARLWLDYDGFEIACDDPHPAILNIEDWTRLERNAPAEQAMLEQLEEIGIEPSASEFELQHGTLWEALDVLAPLTDKGWTLRGRDKRKLLAGKAKGLRVSSGQDWFDVEGGIEFGDAIVPLPKAIRAFLRGEQTIELEGGGLGVLPQEWLEKHARGLSMGLADSGRGKDARLRFHSAHAMLLDELLDAAETKALPKDFADLRRRMRNFAGVTPPAPPQGLQGQLRPYQHEALGWFDFLATFGFGGVLADDMGLGKTIQALAWLALEKERGAGGPTLVVAPTSLLFNWRDEATRFTPDLSVLPYAGLDRAGLAASFSEHDLVLTTYGLLRRDIEVLRPIRWRCLILDESQAIKNPDSQTAKAARVLEADRRLCMTGTPLENRLDELWSQMQFLNPSMLGSRKGFDARFGKPVAQGDDAARELLQRVIRPFVLRRTKEAVAKDLPEKQESVIRCDMPSGQAKVYARLRDHYRSEILAAVDAQGLNRSKIKVLEGLLRLRQAACHPALVGEDAASGKLDELVRTLREVVDEGHKALVFSQFTKFLALIRQRLEADGVPYEYLDGRTPAKTRAQRVTTFQDPSGPPVFCISLKAGGVGLNLTAADYVFIMDPWWNPAVEAQAVDRTHRIGQDKKVFAYRLISTDTIDEKVVKLQQEKRDLAEVLAQGATSTIGSLTREDLEALLA